MQCKKQYLEVIFVEKFLTIRKVAATGILSENFLRQLVAQGKCPGIRSGNRFLVNFPALCELLEAESMKAVKSNG